MSILYYVLGVLAVAFGIGVSIALHEIGHLVPAKLFGVKATQYMIGFGPTMWSTKRGETEYGVKAVPLGGYVRMIGMYPPKPGDDPHLLRSSSTSRWAAMMADARAQSMEEVTPGDEDRVFYKLSTPKKVVVMLGGPLMNLLIAAVLTAGLISLYGVMDPAKPLGAKVSSVSTCIVPNTITLTSNPAVDCANQPVGPAYAAGVRPGDQIMSISGQPVLTSTDIAHLVRPKAGTPLDVVLKRGEETRTVTVTPLAGTLAKLDDKGQAVLDADSKPIPEKAGLMGVTTRPIFAIVPQPVTDTPQYVWNQVSATAGVVLRIPEKMVGIAQAAFGSGERDANGPMSVVGVGRIAGEKAGGELTGSILDDLAVVPFIIQLLAGLNIALFVFNLIPLMPLDGGHVAGALWEGLKRTYARITGRPDPGYVDVAKALPLAYVVASGLIVMSALLIYADLVKPIKI